MTVTPPSAPGRTVFAVVVRCRCAPPSMTLPAVSHFSNQAYSSFIRASDTSGVRSSNSASLLLTNMANFIAGFLSAGRPSRPSPA